MTKTAKQAIMDYFELDLVPESLLKELEAIIKEQAIGEQSGSDMNDYELVNALKNMYGWGISTGQKLERGVIKRVDDRDWEMTAKALDQFEQTFTNRNKRQAKKALSKALYGKETN